MNLRVRTFLTNFLKLLFAIGLIYWLITSGKLNLSALQQLASPSVFFACMLLIGANLIICSERWRKLLLSQGLEATFYQTFRFTLIGIFFNYVIPGGVGGDVVKGYYIVRHHPQSKTVAAITVAMDRFVGLYAMMFLALFVMFLDWTQVTGHPQLKWIFLSLLCLFLGFSIFWTLIFSKRISSNQVIHNFLRKLPKAENLIDLFSSFAKYSETKKIIFITFFYSLIAQSFAVLFFVYVGYALGFSQVNLHTYFFVIPIGLMVTAVPISPAGVGVGQAAFYFLFGLIQPESAPLGAIGITALQMFYFIYGLLGAWYYVSSKPSRTEA